MDLFRCIMRVMVDRNSLKEGTNQMNARKLLAYIAGVVALVGMAGCGDVKSPTYIAPLEEFKVCPELADGSCPSSGNACVPRTQSSPSVVPLNRSLQYCALGRYEVLSEQNGEVILRDDWRNLTSQASWSAGSSGGSAFVDVSASGLATGKVQTPVAVPITARFDGFESESHLRVSAPRLEDVDINPNGNVSTLIDLEVDFQCLGEFSGACSTTGSTTCDISNTANFVSSEEGVFAFDSALGFGTGVALSAGDSTISCSDEGLESDPDASLTVCSDESISDVEIRIPPSNEPASVLALAVGSERQLQLIATYTDCTSEEEEDIEVDVTSAATWTSTAPDVVAVTSPGGFVTTGDVGGFAQITGTFRGVPSDPLAVTVSVANVDRVEVSGPALAVAGFQSTLEYSATAVLTDEAGEEIEELDVTQEVLWSSSAPDVIAFTPGNGGTATLDAEAEPQVVSVTATYGEVQGTVDTQVLTPAAVKDLTIVPDVACIGDALSLGLLSDTPIKLLAVAELEYTDAEGATQSCAVDATDNADWVAGGANVTSGLLGNLLDPIPGLNLIGDLLSEILTTLVGDCEDAGLLLPGLPLTIGSDPLGSPVSVTNTAPGKGVVAPNGESISLAGGACVYAGINDVVAAASVLVATELQPVCEALLASAPPQVEACPGEDLSGAGNPLPFPVR